MSKMKIKIPRQDDPSKVDMTFTSSTGFRVILTHGTFLRKVKKENPKG